MAITDATSTPVRLPTVPRPEPKNSEVVVKAGDTLWGIAGNLVKEAGPVTDGLVARKVLELKVANPQLRRDGALITPKERIQTTDRSASIPVATLRPEPTLAVEGAPPAVAAADAAGDHDGQASLAELKSHAAAIYEKVQSAVPGQLTDAQLTELSQAFTTLKDSAIELDKRVKPASDLAHLAQVIDERFGNRDDKISRFEVEGFVKTRAARAAMAAASSDPKVRAQAGTETMLMDLGKELLKLLPKG